MADYKSAHLAWIHSTKSFTPKYAQDYTEPYYEIMKQTYSNSACTQEIAKSFFVADKLWHRQTVALSREIDKEIEKSRPSPNGKWFVTVGFNHDTWTVVDCDKYITQMIAMDWVISAKANFEFYRANGEHPHCHFIIETKDPKSSILYNMFRPNYAKKVIGGRNFIEIEVAQEHHIKYINLDKCAEKMLLVEKDIIWRNANKIPDYEKNWTSTL